MQSYTLAFYNVENLYDTVNDENLRENSFLPNGRKKWTRERYNNKIHKLAKAISQIGYKETKDYPLLVGLAEVENKQVVCDLVASMHLEEAKYGVIHYDSLDERGIDNAMLYRKDIFKLIQSRAVRVILEHSNGTSDYTRDILYVEGELEQIRMHLFVLHLPSKRENDINKDKRALLMQKLKYEIEGIQKDNPDAFIVIMGDMNDNPDNPDARDILNIHTEKENLNKKDLYSPMIHMQSYDRGSLMYNRKWLLFDQIIFSSSFFNDENLVNLEKADIFDASFLKEYSRRYKGQPFRTFVGTKYLGGYSDHFPVYAIIKV